MTASESARVQWQKLKDKPLKDKLAHILTYYWGYLAIILGVVAVAGSILFHHLTAKDPALQVFFSHAACTEEASEPFLQQFADDVGIDTAEYALTLETGSDSAAGNTELAYGDAQLLSARLAAGDLDVLGGDLTSMITYAYGGYYSDLRQHTTNGQLKQWEPYLLYMDQALFEEIEQNPDPTRSYTLPDPAKPKEMEHPIPFAVSVPASGALAETCTFFCEEPVMGIAVSASHPDNAILFFDYVLQ